MVLRLSAGLYLLTIGLLGTREWYVALGCWLAGSIAVPVGHGVRAGGEMGWEAWRPRTRGVLVEGHRVYARPYEFTDVEGRTRRLTDDYASGERVEILHDPAPGRDTAQIGRRTRGLWSSPAVSACCPSSWPRPWPPSVWRGRSPLWASSPLVCKNSWQNETRDVLGSGEDRSVLADERAAMGDRPPRELISLADDEGNSVSVNVSGA